MRKIKKGINVFFTLLLISFLFIFFYSIFYLKNLYNNLPQIKLQKQYNSDYTSYLLNNDDNIVKTINNSIDYIIEYEDLADDFVNALISIEDASFFNHQGYDLKRITSSLFNNLRAGEITAGASTLTQQLVKNIALNNEQSYDRKLKEAMLAYQLEQEYTKEEILTYYANNVSFEGTRNGINYASYRFFNKPINEVTLPEAAMLAALVKSPTLYNPYKYPVKCNERKNLVLDAMYNNGYISKNEAEIAKKITIEELLKKNNDANIAYDYQAYLDIVYQEINEITGLDPYTTPMKVHTYLNEELQRMFDTIQKNEDIDIKFDNDDEQNIGGAVIDNKNGGIIAALGGREYEGEKLYNHAYDMRQQPASSIKPVLSYALAYQHLNWSSAHVLNDVPIKYKGTDINVNNVDGQYLGEILIEDAIGYSRNTTAVKTLEEVADVIGMKGITDYLSKINILDVEPELVNYSYALGGMYNGVSPIQLSGAYAMIANYGIYTQPTTIKYIELLDGSNTIYDNTKESIRVIEEDSAFLIANSLINVIDKNYWGIGSVKVNNVKIGGKTGTSSFDSSLARKLNYPSNANKDIWFAGFSKDYSMAIWTGFDKFEEGKNNYFKPSGDLRTRIPRNIFKKVMEKIAARDVSFPIPNNITTQTIIKGIYPYLLPPDYIDNKFLITAYFKKNYLPSKTFETPLLPNLNKVDVFYYDNRAEIHFPLVTEDIYSQFKYGRSIFSLEEIIGKPLYCLEVTINGVTQTYSSTTNIIEIPYDLFNEYTIDAYYSYEKVLSIKSNYYRTYLQIWE